MSKLYIVGGNELNGRLKIPSAKNSLLPIIGASLLVDGVVKINNFSNFTDCMVMIRILENLGAKITFGDNRSLIIDSRDINAWTILSELAKELRSSFFTLGAILGRLKLAKVAYPGGCNIGARPVDIHLKAFRELGVSIVERHGYIYCNADRIKPSKIHLDYPSVGATENIIMASACLKGYTVITNCAKEPEIIDLQNFLNSCGADIKGAGTDTIKIKGVNRLLHSTEYTCIGDRIIAGTYAIATACCGGQVELHNINPRYLKSLIDVMKQANVRIDENDNGIRIVSDGKLKSVNKIETMPYPLFPTDLQSQMLVMQCVSSGSSLITENIFESRFKIVPELVKMGADITVKSNMAYVNGVNKLYGADVYASDLRAGAGLVIAGLIADGYTTVHNVNYIDRGYENIENDLSLLGASIKRIE